MIICSLWFVRNEQKEELIGYISSCGMFAHSRTIFKKVASQRVGVKLGVGNFKFIDMNKLCDCAACQLKRRHENQALNEAFKFNLSDEDKKEARRLLSKISSGNTVKLVKGCLTCVNDSLDRCKYPCSACDAKYSKWQPE